MSRRKQEKPQPRKNLVTGDAVELAQDILTCGVCQRDFFLCDIVRFIQHKVNTCNNKENSCVNKLFVVPPDDSDSEDVLCALARSKPPLELLGVSSPSTLKIAKDSSPAKNKEVVGEPCSYKCSTCKQTFTSAWTLLQHVQNQHGLKIYVDCNSSPIEKTAEQKDVKPCIEQSPSSQSALRAPLLERQLDSKTPPLFPRSSSQDLRIDLLGLSSTSNHLAAAQSPPPPLIEVHHLDTSPQASSLGLGYEPQLDFYSQRLRELAGATSPNALASSPAKLLQPSFKAVVNDKPNANPSNASENNQVNASTTPPQLPQSSASSTTSENQPLSPKSNPKACEFCGKSFRFMSNLIVHRRSHTGEKPFKCHICNHACTQASKLKRHMKTHKRKKRGSSSDKPLALDGSAAKNGIKYSEESENNKQLLEGQTNGEREYISDDQAVGSHHNEDDDEEDEEIDVEEDDDDEDAEHDGEQKKYKDVLVAEDLSKKPMKNGTSGNNSSVVKVEKKDNNTIRHSLLSEVMEKIGLASIQQYSEAYKQALKESSVLKQDRHSDGSASNDGANYIERPSREGTRSAGQSPLSFNTGLLSAFVDQSVGLKRIKLEDQWREKEENSLYAGLWIPSVSSHSSSYKDLYSADGSDRRKSKTESALNCMSPSTHSGRSSSPRPGPSTSLCNLGSITNSLLKPKEQRRNDTCEFCGKVFKNCSNLTVHRRSHTGEKPYKCELCSYACAQSSKLTRHMKTHGRMGKDVYRCRFCDMPFSVPSTLEKHMRKCVVSQSGGSSFLLSERESDSKEMTS